MARVAEFDEQTSRQAARCLIQRSVSRAFEVRERASWRGGDVAMVRLWVHDPWTSAVAADFRTWTCITAGHIPRWYRDCGGDWREVYRCRLDKTRRPSDGVEDELCSYFLTSLLPYSLTPLLPCSFLQGSEVRGSKLCLGAACPWLVVLRGRGQHQTVRATCCARTSGNGAGSVGLGHGQCGECR